MAALSGERSCQNGRRAKRQGLLVGGLTRLGGASQDLPAARKPFRTGQQSSSLSFKLQGGKESAADSIESVALLNSESSASRTSVSTNWFGRCSNKERKSRPEAGEWCRELESRILDYLRHKGHTPQPVMQAQSCASQPSGSPPFCMQRS